MEVILYTTHCPQCKVLDMKLKEKGIKYTECTDIDEMIKLGITSAPQLQVDKKLLDFSEAIKWMRGQ